MRYPACDVRRTAGVLLRGPERSEGHVSRNDRVGLRGPERSEGHVKKRPSWTALRAMAFFSCSRPYKSSELVAR